MTTETGNAQSEVADPSQVYGLARWLSSDPLFTELNTPKAIYGGPSAGRMNIGQQAATAPQVSVSRFDDMASGGVDGDSLGVGGGAAKWGATEEKFASPFSSTNYGRYGSTIGNAVLGPAGGVLGTAVGGYFDIDNLDQQQTSLGFAGPLNGDQVMSGYLNKSMFGILGDSWEQASINNLLDAIVKYEQANPELMNLLNQDSWSDDRAVSHYGVQFENTDEDNDFGWGNDDDDGEGSAQGGRGDADGGGWD